MYAGLAGVSPLFFFMGGLTGNPIPLLTSVEEHGTIYQVEHR